MKNYKELAEEYVIEALQNRMEESDDHPHQEAMDDHESVAAEHRDNEDHPKAGVHHKLAHEAHKEAARHLEYGRKNDAKKAAERAHAHAKKAHAAGGADLVSDSHSVLKNHH